MLLTQVIACHGVADPINFITGGVTVPRAYLFRTILKAFENLQ